MARPPAAQVVVHVWAGRTRAATPTTLFRRLDEVPSDSDEPHPSHFQPGTGGLERAMGD